MVVINKMVQVESGRCEEKIVAESAGTECILAYAKKHKALFGTFGEKLVIEFADGATCVTEFDSEADLQDWIQLNASGHIECFSAASGVANFKVLVLDETGKWDRVFAEKAGGKIYATYLYNAAQAVHLCELKASFYLRHLFSTPLVDDAEGSIAEEIRMAEAGCENDIYYHCNVVESLPAKQKLFDYGFELFDENADGASTLRELEDAHAEDCRGNCGSFEFPLASQ